MNEMIFKQALIKTLEEKNQKAEEKKYIIYPIFEKGKKYNSKDDFVRLSIFPPNKISKIEFEFEDVIKRFSILAPYYPLWIDVYIRNDNIIELYTSLRFRRPSELLRKETGHAPFMIIDKM